MHIVIQSSQLSCPVYAIHGRLFPLPSPLPNANSLDIHHYGVKSLKPIC